MDREILDNLKWKLESDPRIDSNKITVRVKDGIVTLTGHVKHFYQKGYIEDDVKSVVGVLGIAEELEVDLLGSKPPDDADLVRAVLDSLGRDVMFSENKHNFQVIVEKGVVTLTGQVTYRFQKDRAFENVRYIKGVKAIINKISVKPLIKPSYVKEQITDNFVRSARLDAEDIKVEVDGAVVTLRGNVHSWFEHKEAELVANLIPGVSKVRNLIKLI